MLQKKRLSLLQKVIAGFDRVRSAFRGSSEHRALRCDFVDDVLELLVKTCEIGFILVLFGLFQVFVGDAALRSLKHIEVNTLCFFQKIIKIQKNELTVWGNVRRI